MSRYPVRPSRSGERYFFTVLGTSTGPRKGHLGGLGMSLEIKGIAVRVEQPPP